ncbi:MAG: GNAT family N-acetyltransferase [Nodosilinea sp.]
MTQFASDPSLALAPGLADPLIREAHCDDLAQLGDLLTSSFYDRSGWMRWVYPVIKLGILEDLRQRLKSQKPNYACLTALYTGFSQVSKQGLAPGIVVGTAEVSQRQAWPWQGLEPRYAYVSNLAVGSAFRRRGVASALLATCEQLALDWQVYDLYLHVMEDNVEARRLYHKAGFRLFEAEDTPASWFGLQPRRLLMYKLLAPSHPSGDADKTRDHRVTSHNP